MTIVSFLRKQGFDLRWLEWEMYPAQLFEIQQESAAGKVAAEHCRYGAIRWWLSQELSAAEIAKLLLLCHLDADSSMRAAALRDIELRYGDRSIAIRDLTIGKLA